MKSAAEREEARKKAELEEEEAARQPLLNDTSFDRRRVMAVYKEDGSRGHHMQVCPHWRLLAYSILSCKTYSQECQDCVPYPERATTP